MAEAPGTFGELVYEQRRRLRMGRARLAAMVGRSPDAVTRWEKEGVAPRDAATLEELAKALKLEPSRLAELAERARDDSREVPIVASPLPVPHPRPARPVAPPLTAPVEGAPAASVEETAVPPVLPVPPALPAPAEVREPIRRGVVPAPARPAADAAPPTAAPAAAPRQTSWIRPWRRRNSPRPKPALRL